MPPSRIAPERPTLRAKKRVTKAYINELHERISALTHRLGQQKPVNQSGNRENRLTIGSNSPGHSPDESTALLPPSENSHNPEPLTQDVSALVSNLCDKTRIKAPLTNPLAFHITDWVPGPTGKLLFMGTSSTWAFARRVLGMTHVKLTGSTLFPDRNNLLFDDQVYDIKWDGNKASLPHNSFDVSNLPTPDFANFIISSVRFHCGQLFYLFDDEHFMNHFEKFQRDPIAESRKSPLWFCHYLLLLAFGKFFVVQSSESERPAGVEYFIQAMQCIPDFSFFEGDPIERIQVMCCAALYLQSIHRRGPAYRMIGNALRLSLEHGMHTEMHGSCLDKHYVQKSRLVWWTVYILERRMSSLLGVPLGISEESISAPFPSTSAQIDSSNTLEMQAKLCQILAKVDLTVYGVEGKLDIRYLSATQTVLRDIAHVTELLNQSFDLFSNGSVRATSRSSAHLHILEHQCIILTTRPLLYIFLQSRLGHSDPALMDWLQVDTIKALISICVESAQETLRILSNLQEQGVLEVFLPFDMDAAFMSTVSLLLAAAIEPSILRDHTPWSKRAYAILENMSSRGNISARLIQKELRQLDDELAQLMVGSNLTTFLSPSLPREPHRGRNQGGTIPAVVEEGPSPFMDLGLTGFGQHYELCSDQLMDLANSLDLDSLTWPLPHLSTDLEM
ncbi:fungal-specific transcription factor domain-containing protein [Penicillium citrinum]|uniref:Fungal-specific transcription factor domain-containing protein n=1 Tax=Penicillium citrinum TaxID=5077 RepID=A0A9W9TM16_PENCI|nr:fungal-specific transcription factor domain-containing protein [Penicillium citrinum]KAJ5231277.1 fungal-specific transcription factor domain-containing protein [Penicillium citrinum]